MISKKTKNKLMAALMMSVVTTDAVAEVPMNFMGVNIRAVAKAQELGDIAVFNTKIASTHLVTFKNGITGDIIQKSYVNEGETVTLPANPCIDGYTFDGWNKTADDIKTAKGDIEVTALFKKNENEIKYNVTVSGGTISGGGTSGQYDIREVISVTANDPEERKKFSYWTDENGKILSYSTTYHFYAIKDATIIANYVADTTVVEAKGTAEIINIDKNTKESKIIFVSMVTVPEGCKIQIAGIIGTDEEAVGTSGDGFNKDTAAYVRGNAWSGNAYKFTWTKKVTADQTWYVRAYLVYEDTTGNLITVYGDMISATIDTENAYKAQLATATNAVVKAETDKTQASVDSARLLVNALRTADKTSLGARLDKIQKSIDAINEAKELVAKAKVSLSREDYNIALSSVMALPEIAVKYDLLRELRELNINITKQENKDRLTQYANLRAAEDAVRIASIKKDDESIAKAQELINKMKDGIDKDRLQNWLDSFADKTKLSIAQIIQLQRNAEDAIKKAERTKIQADIDIAQESVNAIPDTVKNKVTLQARLDKVVVKEDNTTPAFDPNTIQAMRNAEDALKRAELNNTSENLKEAEKLVNALPTSDKKDSFLKRINAEKLMQLAETTPTEETLTAARNAVNELPYIMAKYNLLKRIAQVQKTLTK